MTELKTMTVEEIARLHPESLVVFQKYRIDLCCGGRFTLEQVAKKHKIKLDRLIEDLTWAIPTAT